MIFPAISSFDTTLFFFLENFSYNNNNLIYTNYNFSFSFIDYSDYTFLNIFNDSNLYTKSLLLFIDQTEDLQFLNNLENVSSVYHYSIPNVKLAYPEPFIASPSFMHTDL